MGEWNAGIFPIMLYKNAYGNHLGTLIYVWCIPVNEPVDSAVVSQVFSQLCNEQNLDYGMHSML